MHVVLPVKPFAAAKSRLSALFSAEQRASLARAMLEDVLEQVAPWPLADRVVIVSDEAELRGLQAAHDFDVVAEGARQDLNAALEHALDRIAARGATRALVLHADLPLLERAELTVAAAHPAEALVLVPDRTRQGTNGLVTSLPHRLTLQYGPQSFAAHGQQARERGMSFRTESLPSLALDVDTEADVHEVLAVARRDPSRASRRTVQLLRKWLA